MSFVSGGTMMQVTFGLRSVFILVLVMVLTVSMTSCLPRGAAPEVHLLASPLSWKPEASALIVREVAIPSYVNQSSLMQLNDDGTIEALAGCRWAMPLRESLLEAINCALSSREAAYSGSGKCSFILELPVFIITGGRVLNVRGTIINNSTGARHGIAFEKSMNGGKLDAAAAGRLHREAVEQLAAEIIDFANSR
jgi:hypothetical protein